MNVLKLLSNHEMCVYNKYLGLLGKSKSILFLMGSNEQNKNYF